MDVKVVDLEKKVHQAIEFEGVVQSSNNQSGRKQKVEAEDWSSAFPARYVASLMAERLDLNNPEIPFSPTDTDLQYVTPASHRDMLLTIAETDRKAFALRFKDILALSLRIDGAVDKQRIDNKHVMAQVVTAVGDMEIWYMGLAESEKRGSEGLLEALRKASAKCGATWPAIFNP